MINFPLYAMRGFVEIFTEGPYKVITTNKTRYVLDVDLPELSYSERRLAILADTEKPYDIYPLSQRVESINQILLTKKKDFIDKDGKLFKWKPRTFYPVNCLLIKSRWETAKGTWGIEVQGIGTKFIVSNANYKYAQVLQVGAVNILYDLSNEYLKKTRKKL